ncbi:MULTISPECIES: hypothetical protein [Shewanella]|jgi:hypothetical protein|uniref:hypothetical protein n=1 Tax=Shewanella TaxID=22 RepID=UPI001055272A|nr:MULTISPECIES: hypothetical protein [Shewanella]MBO1270909.1 hypothetical protein [Shewanella sp. 4t3-1-2LB]
MHNSSFMGTDAEWRGDESITVRRFVMTKFKPDTDGCCGHYVTTRRSNTGLMGKQQLTYGIAQYRRIDCYLIQTHVNKLRNT